MAKRREAIERYWTYSRGLTYSRDNMCSDTIARATEQYIQNGITTYVGARAGSLITSSGDKVYAVLFESGQGTTHYVYIDNLDDYIAFMRNYGNLTQIFDTLVQPIIEEWERLQARRNATIGGGYGYGPSAMY